MHFSLQGLWKIENFTVGSTDLVAEFLCVWTGYAGQVGDIAILLDGTIVVRD